MTRALLLALAVCTLASCGKRGGPVPPGPTSELIYPRTYPSK